MTISSTRQLQCYSYSVPFHPKRSVIIKITHDVIREKCNRPHRLIINRFETTLSIKFLLSGPYCVDSGVTQYTCEISCRGDQFSGISSSHPPYRGASVEHVFPRGVCTRLGRAPRGALGKNISCLEFVLDFRTRVFFPLARSSALPTHVNVSMANPEAFPLYNDCVQVLFLFLMTIARVSQCS